MSLFPFVLELVRIENVGAPPGYCSWTCFPHGGAPIFRILTSSRHKFKAHKTVS